MRLPAWWSWWSLWSFFKFIGPFAVSFVALGFVLHDRRARIQLKAKRGDWCVLNSVLSGGEIVFTGVIEIYNASSRANAIRDYQFFRQESDKDWTPMKSEQYNLETGYGKEPEIHNKTALTLAPYSGIEAKVQAITKMKAKPYELIVKIVVYDLFDKSYTLKVKATMK
jgi:hypothetical protein